MLFLIEFSCTRYLAFVCHVVAQCTSLVPVQCPLSAHLAALSPAQCVELHGLRSATQDVQLYGRGLVLRHRGEHPAGGLHGNRLLDAVPAVGQLCPPGPVEILHVRKVLHADRQHRWAPPPVTPLNHPLTSHTMRSLCCHIAHKSSNEWDLIYQKNKWQSFDFRALVKQIWPFPLSMQAQKSCPVLILLWRGTRCHCTTLFLCLLYQTGIMYHEGHRVVTRTIFGHYIDRIKGGIKWHIVLNYTFINIHRWTSKSSMRAMIVHTEWEQLFPVEMKTQYRSAA